MTLIGSRFEMWAGQLGQDLELIYSRSSTCLRLRFKVQYIRCDPFLPMMVGMLCSQTLQGSRSLCLPSRYQGRHTREQGESTEVVRERDGKEKYARQGQRHRRKTVEA